MPTQQTLSAEDEAHLRECVRAMAPFPRYLYSGCDDRAHAAYLLLPAALRGKLMKVWVVSPAKYTTGMPGSIRSTRTGDPVFEAVDWGFHVALAYRTQEFGPASHGALAWEPANLMVIDPALRPGEVIPVHAWFAEMHLSPLTLWTLTEGSAYGHHVDWPPVAGTTNHQVWTGHTYGYVDLALEGNWIPQAMARDAVGELAIQGKACAELNALAALPGELLERLKAGGGAAECGPGFALFASELKRWTELVAAAL